MQIRGRRRFLGAGVRIVAGVASAALFGCGPDQPSASGAASGSVTTPTPSASTTGAPAARVRFNADLHVIVDKQRALPDGYTPPGLQAIPAACSCTCGQALASAFLTYREVVPTETRRRLASLLEPYWWPTP